jgi:hypothetical protein
MAHACSLKVSSTGLRPFCDELAAGLARKARNDTGTVGRNQGHCQQTGGQRRDAAEQYSCPDSHLLELAERRAESDLLLLPRTCGLDELEGVMPMASLDAVRSEIVVITYHDVYFLGRARAADEALHFHELVHIVQWQVLGPERFILAYALGHVIGGGYSANPFEQIAYGLQDPLARQEKPFNVESIVERHLSQAIPALLAAVSR